MQKQIWIDMQSRKESCLHTIVHPYRLSGQLDVARLERACELLVERHSVFRMRITECNGELFQQPGPPVRPVFRQQDFSSFEARLKAEHLSRIQNELTRIVFDPAQSLVPRFDLIRISQSEHVLFRTYNHLVSDGLTHRLLWAELAGLYQRLGNESDTQLPVVTADFYEFARAVSQQNARPEIEALIAEEARRLGGLSPLQVETESRRQDAQPGAREVVLFDIDSDLANALDRIGRDLDATPFEVWLGFSAAFLSRHQGGDCVVLNSPIGRRPHRRYRNVAGCFVHLVLFDLHVDESTGFMDFLRNSRDHIRLLSRRDQVPFDRLMMALDTEGVDASTLNRFQFQLTGFRDHEVCTDNLHWHSMDVISAYAGVDLACEIKRRNGIYQGCFKFDSNRFDKTAIEKMSERLGVFLQRIVEAPDLPLGGMSVLPAKELDTILFEWNNTSCPRAVEATHHGIEAWARQTPSAIAVQSNGVCITYEELDEQANWIAGELIDRGLSPGDRVVILMSHSSACIVAMLAAMKLGVIYVPISPIQPLARIQKVLSDSEPALCLVDVTTHHLAGADHPTWLLPGNLPRRRDCPRLSEITADQPVYLIYTSGSTGRPKGVLIPHRGFMNHNRYMVETCGIGPSSICLCSTVLDFDVGQAEVFMALIAGARIVLWDNELEKTPDNYLDVIASNAVTHAFTLTPLWHGIVERLEAGRALPDSLEWMPIGADAALLDKFEKWRRLVGSEVRWANAYGPTEASVYATLYQADFDSANSDELSSVPIGRPIANTRIYILDRKLRPLPLGVAGELVIAGDGLAICYWRRPEETERVFPAGPFAHIPESRLYRTGDLARYRFDGQIEYLGRIDRQVKLRGYRVEPGEIEEVLCRHADVSGAAVIAEMSAGVGNRLLAFVCPADVVVSGIGAYLAKELPPYMQPAQIVAIDHIPVLANQKPDIAGLRRLIPPRPVKTETANLTPLESSIVDICGEVLGCEAVDLDDNLIRLGAHSIAMMRISAKIFDLTGVRPTIPMLLDNARLGDLAGLIERKLQT